MRQWALETAALYQPRKHMLLHHLQRHRCLSQYTLANRLEVTPFPTSQLATPANPLLPGNPLLAHHPTLADGVGDGGLDECSTLDTPRLRDEVP